MEKGMLIKQVALDAGADKAAVIAQSDIVLSEEFREICRSNGCGKYNRCWMCPPDIGEIARLMEQIRAYSGAVLYQTISSIEDSFDIEGMLKAGQAHAELSREIHRQLKTMQTDNLLHLTCGGCRLCTSCAKEEDMPCRFPESALPSLEGYGVDVYRTTLGTDLKYINGENTVTFFGMVLYREENNG